RPRNVVAVTLNQTFEARRREAPEEGSGAAGRGTGAGDPGGPPAADPNDPMAGDPDVPLSDSASIADLTAPGAPGQEQQDGGPRRIQRPPVTTLLGLTTSVVRYDFVEADSSGMFLAGFQTTELSNQITSDYLRGLSISMRHQLFADSLADGALFERRFQPHLASLNLGFSLSSRSGIVRWLGLGGGGGDDMTPEEEDEAFDDLDDPFGDDMMGEGSIIPGTADEATAPGPLQGSQARSSDIGQWNANISYSLQRPRNDPERLSQMLSGTLRLQPTENWDMSWRTSYDLEANAFNDHIIRLTRDLHRWQAHFDFMQTATGNWSFRFEVALTDNRDLKFDYRQRNLDVGLPTQGGGGG
ncbi:MAG: hypothetical protein WEA34_05225, partial [Gemmatimonadota bacterium]